jgi:Transposase
MIEAARMVKRHWNGILRWFHSKITNGIMEAINSLVQAAKAKARGYPFHPQPEGDHLSNCRQARTRPTHMSQRRALMYDIQVDQLLASYSRGISTVIATYMHNFVIMAIYVCLFLLPFSIKGLSLCVRGRKML